MGRSTYKPPDFSRGQSKYARKYDVSNVLNTPSIDWSKFQGNNLPASAKAALTKVKKAPPADKPWYEDIWGGIKDAGSAALEELHQIASGGRNVVSRQILPALPWYDPADAARNKSGDQSILGALKAIGKDFMEGYKDPNMVDSGRTIFNQAVLGGNKNDIPYLSGIGGAIANILTDPLTFAPGGVVVGSGSKVKAVQNAAKIAEKEIAKKGLKGEAAEAARINARKIAEAKANNQLLGLDIPFTSKEITVIKKPKVLTKQSQTISEQAAKHLTDQFVKHGTSPDQARKMVQAMYGKDIRKLNTQEYDHAIRQFQNGLGDKIKQALDTIGDPFVSGSSKTKKVLLKNNSADAQLIDVANKIAPKVNVATNPQTYTELRNFLAQYGGFNKKDLKTLPKKDLQDLVAELKPKVVQDLARMEAKGLDKNLDELIKGTAGKTPAKLAERVRMSAVVGLRDLPKLEGVSSNLKIPKSTAVNTIEDSLSDLGKQAAKSYYHVEGLDGVSALGKLIKGNKAVEALGRTLGSRRYTPVSSQIADHRTATGVGAVLDANNAGRAYTSQGLKQLEKELRSSDALKGLTKEELQYVPFIMEGKIPASLQDTIANLPPEKMAQIQQVADHLRKVMDDVTDFEQRMGATYNVRENYFPHYMNPEGTTDKAVLDFIQNTNPTLFHRIMNSEKGFNKQRVAFQTMADLWDALQANPQLAEQFKATFDPLEAIGRRIAQGAHEAARREMFQNLEQLGILQPVREGEHLAEGWVRLKEIPGMENVAVPKDVHKQITYVDKLLTSDHEAAKLLNKAEKMYNIWRRNVTVVRAGFHIRQIIGNIFQNALAGVRPTAYTAAIKILKNPEKHQRVYEMALHDGILSTGTASADYATTVASEINQRLNKASKLQKLNPLGEQFVFGTMGRNAGEWEDNVARLAHYVDMIEKGMTREEARDSVRKYLFNYSEINKFGRALRVVFPFYQWMRNNLPFQIVNAVKNPTKYMVIAHFMDEAQQEPDAEQAMTEAGIRSPQDRQLMQGIIKDNGGLLPDYIQKSYAKLGNGGYFNIGLPASDLASLQNPGKMLMESLNPLFNTASDLSRNQKGLNGAPVDPGVQQGQSVFLTPEGIRHSIDQLGGAPGQFLTNLSDAFGLSQSMGVKPKAEGVGDALFRSAGLKPTQVDLAKEVLNLLYNAARDAQLRTNQAKKKEKQQ